MIRTIAQLALSTTLATLAAAPAEALPAWERIGPDGGPIWALAAAPSQPAVIYAGTSGGVFRSEDRGLSWQFAGSGLGRGGCASLAVDARKSASVWAIASGALFQTSDGGKNWRSLISPEPTAALGQVAAHPRSVSHLWLRSQSRVWRSEDGGDSWTDSSAGLQGADLRQLVVDPARPEHLFIATLTSGVYRSLDGGRAWRAVNKGLPGAYPAVVALGLDARDGKTLYAALQPAGLYRSVDAGNSWKKIASSWPAYAAASIAVVGRTVYVGTFWHGVFSSRDGGRSFPPAQLRLRGQQVRALLGTSFGLLAGSDIGVYRTADGLEWQSSQSGLWARDLSFLRIDPRASDRWYLIDPNSGVLRSLNAGGLWRRAGNQILAPELSTFLTSLDVDPMNSRVYAGIAGGIGISDDGARTWRVQSVFGCAGPYAILGDPAHGRIHVGGQLLIGECFLLPNHCDQFRSDDDGDTFSCAESRLPSARYLAERPDGTEIFATSAHEFYKSTDGGDSWSLVGTPGHPLAHFAISPADPDVLYAVFADVQPVTIVRSDDAGGTWQIGDSDLAQYLIYDLLADPIEANRVYTATPEGALVSTDGGVSWLKLGYGADEVVINGLTFDPRDPALLYATTTGGGLMRLEIER